MTTHDLGSTLLYADETIEPRLVDFLVWSGLAVESAAGLGIVARSPRAHLAEAGRRGRILLTRDELFLDPSVFPLDELGRTGVVLVATSGESLDFGGVLYSLLALIGPAGTATLVGEKLVLRAGQVIRHSARRAPVGIALAPGRWGVASRRVAQA